MKEVMLIVISRIDYEDETSEYIAKMSSKFRDMQHIKGVGESPFIALTELEDAVDMYMESVEKQEAKINTNVS